MRTQTTEEGGGGDIVVGFKRRKGGRVDSVTFRITERGRRKKFCFSAGIRRKQESHDGGGGTTANGLCFSA